MSKKMNDEYLIRLVKDRRELFDPECKLYQDQGRREKSWQEIGKKMKQSAFDCKDRWKRLRDNYRKAKKLRQTKKRQGITKIKKIKHEQIIAFIDPMLDINETTESLVEGDEDSESADSSSEILKEREEYNEASIPETSAKTYLVLDDTRNYAEETQATDTVVTLFTNLGETVKTFPEEIQIRVKRDIFKIVNEAEEEVYIRSNCSRNRKVQVKNEQSY